MMRAALLLVAVTNTIQPNHEVNLRIWAETGQLKAIEELLATAEDIDVDVSDAQGWTALMYAAKSNKEAIVTLLLNVGADHRLTNDFCETALHVAARKGSTEVVRILLDAGANLVLRDSEDRTPLFRAIEQQQANVIDLLQATARKRARMGHPTAVDEQKGEIVPPEILDYVQPEYTKSASQQEVEGIVVLKVLLRETGRVGAVRVTKSLEASLDYSAIKAVKQWTFVPARRKGIPLNVVIDIEITFEHTPKGKF